MRKILSFFMSLVIVVNNLAFLADFRASAEEAEDFNIYCYIADNMLNKELSSFDTLNYYLNDSKTMAEIWVEEATDEFIQSVAAWEAINLIVKPEDAGEKVLKAEDYYLNIIMTMLSTNYEGNNVLSKISGATSDVKSVASWYNGFAKLYKATYNASFDDFLNSDWSDEAFAKMKSLSDSYMRNEKLLAVGESCNDILDALEKVTKPQEYVDKFISYCMVSQVAEDWKHCLKFMYDNCDKSNIALTSALETLINCSASWRNAAIEVGKDIAADTAVYAYDKLAGKLMDKVCSHPFLKGVRLGYGLGKKITNLLFGTDKTIETFYTLNAYCEILQLIKKGFVAAADTYASDKTEPNARLFGSYVNILFTAINQGNEYGKQYADILFNGGVVNWLFKNEEEYNKTVSYYETFANSLECNHKSIMTSWIYELEADNPEQYAYYASFVDIEGLNIPVISVEFERDSVEWGVNDILFTGYSYNVYPSNATAPRIIMSSSDESVVYFDALGMPRARGTGTCTITVTASGNSNTVTDTLTVNVIAGAGADSLNIDSVTPIEPVEPDYTDFEYTIADGEVTITGYNGSSANIIIPDEIEGYPVRVIGDGAFENNDDIKRVVISDGITSIGWYSFSYCDSLKSISIPDSIIKIEEDAFYKSSLLKADEVAHYIGNWLIEWEYTVYSSPYIKDGTVGIADSAFNGCIYAEVPVVIPEGVKHIGSAFYGCENLSSIELPNSLLTIGDYAFAGCISLKSIDIPDNVEYIGERAFCNCNKISMVQIGKKVSYIGSEAFAFCSSLTNIELPDSVVFVGDDALPYETLYDVSIGDGITDLSGFRFCEDDVIRNVNIGNGITTINTRAFYDCDLLTTVSLGINVSSIGEEAFKYCYELKDILIPASVHTISKDAFYNCFGIENVYYEGSKEQWDEIVINTGNSYLKFAEIHYNCDRLCLLPTPTITTATPAAAAVTLEWSEVDGAESYEIYRTDSENGTKTLIKTVDELFYRDHTVSPETTYYYFVRAYNPETKLYSDYASVSVTTKNAKLTDATDYLLNDVSGAVYVRMDLSDAADWSADTGISPEKIYGIRYYVEFDPDELADEDMWIGGGIGANSPSTGWLCNEWGNSEKPIVADVANGTVTWLSDSPVFTAEDEYCQFWLQTWNGTVKIKSIDILGADGKVLDIPTEEDKVSSFVERLYATMLGRESDITGKANHISSLKNGKTAAEVGAKFVASKELINKGLSNDEFVLRMYQTFLNRTPSAKEITRWATTLENGCTYEYVLKKFVASAEFKNLCAEYGITAGTYEPAGNRDYDENITAFVSRMYTTLLGRSFDANGLNNNAGIIINGGTAADVGKKFVMSGELTNLKLSNDEFVKRMYQTFLNRTPSAKEITRWATTLENGCSYGYILKKFVASAEFNILCTKYNIKAGEYATTENRDYNENITAYVSRMYTKALGRSFDIKGLNNNTGRLITGEMTAAEVAEYFILSKEFVNRKLTDEQFVTVLYNALFNRAPDAGGKTRWLNKLATGTSREEVLKGFTTAAEFKNLVKSFGL